MSAMWKTFLALGPILYAHWDLTRMALGPYPYARLLLSIDIKEENPVFHKLNTYVLNTK